MKQELFEELLESVREAKAIMRGEKPPSRVFVYDEPNVKTIRRRFKLSQPKFAGLLGISVGTLRNWEQGRRQPEGAARVLLLVAAKHPDAILDAVHPRGLMRSIQRRPAAQLSVKRARKEKFKRKLTKGLKYDRAT
jgi:putative transcriptional regulator